MRNVASAAMDNVLQEDFLASIPPAAIAFAEMAELRRKLDAKAGLFVEGVDYDVVNVNEDAARECFKPGSLG